MTNLRLARWWFGPTRCSSALAGSSFGFCGTSLPRTARLRIVWRSCSMCSDRVVRRGRWRRWKRACSRNLTASAPLFSRCSDAAASYPAGSRAPLRRFQPITQRHKFIHFGDDAVLFREGRKGNGKSFDLLPTDAWKRDTSSHGDDRFAQAPDERDGHTGPQRKGESQQRRDLYMRELRRYSVSPCGGTSYTKK